MDSTDIPAGKQKLGKKYGFTQSETKWLELWDSWNIYAYDESCSREETFCVDTPPPTVSGSLHIGHAFSYTHQDLLVRFQRMRGKNIFYPMGWDDNGLPTERRVENHFNFRCDPSLPSDPDLKFEPGAKGRPVNVSRSDFIKACSRMTVQDEEVYKSMWRRLGLSVDWSKEYATISQDARRVSQFSILQLFKAGEIYASEVPMAWDTTFRTAIAQAEMEDREMKGSYYRVRFRISEGGALEIATTRPELLGACVAIMVHPDDKRYENLVGKHAITPLFHVPVPIIKDPRAQIEKGTGIVMVCTFGDTTDVEWWRDHSLPVRQIISENGRLQSIPYGDEGWPSEDPIAARSASEDLSGLTLDQAQKRIVELLSDAGVLVGQPEPIKHAVKFYEKGNKPLEIIMTRQWFIRLLDKRESLLEQGRKIQWHPKFMFERYKNWVAGLNQDWCISRQRYFGVPFPMWYGIDEDGIVNREEPILPNEQMLPIDPSSDTPPGYTPEQRNQPGGFAGETDVLDTWATSSLTPQLATNWPDQPKRHEAVYPMDVRPQSHEIIRTWAFYTIAMSHMHEASVPWKHVVISGWILDPDRKKMSKSKGNVVTPVDLLDQYSADAVRYWAARARVGVDTAYDESAFQVGRKLVTKLFNASKFVSGIIEDTDSENMTSASITKELDRAFIGRLRKAITVATDAYEQFDWATPLMEIETLFWSEFCDDYLELVKTRAYDSDSQSEMRSAHATLRTALSVILRLLAPTLPFVTEEIWSHAFADSLEADQSIHRSAWPSLEELEAIPAPEHAEAFSLTRSVIHEIRRVKGLAGKSMKWPVEQLCVKAPSVDRDALAATRDDLIRTGSVATFQMQDGESLDVEVTLAAQDQPR